MNNGWVNIETDLPDFDELVLWYREDGIMFIDEIDHDNDWHNFKRVHETDFSEQTVKITHWRKLPESPVDNEVKTFSDKGVDILKRIMRYRRGEGKYNFSSGLSDQEREMASIEAWEEIENEILSYLSSVEQNDERSVARKAK